MMKRILPAFILSCILVFPTFGQEEEETGQFLFEEADYWYTEEEDYLEASFLFKRLVNKEPDNANAKFLLGMCYNNIQGMEQEAIPYLTEATKDITLKYKPNRYSVKQAPHHSWYYLADAYRKTNQLDEAMKALEQFSGLKNFEKHYIFRGICPNINSKLYPAHLNR